MKTLLYNTTDAHLQQAAKLLQSGGLVAFPTETVYGLGALGLNPACLQRLYKAKGRPNNNPVILHVHNVQAVRSLVRLDTSTLQQRFEKLAHRFWPGPLTLVCPKADCVPPQTTAGLPKVAVRIPQHPIALQLLQQVNAPLAAPSANLSTRPSATQAQHVLATLSGRIDAIVDAGACSVGVESTVVDISEATVKLLRPGAISQQELRKALAEPVHTSQSNAPQHSDGSPGRIGKHYAPNIAHIALANEAQLAQAWPTQAALLLTQPTFDKLANQLEATRLGPVKTLSQNPQAYAQNLYAALYELEQLCPTMLLIENCFSDEHATALQAAIRDRLHRACLTH